MIFNKKQTQPLPPKEFKFEAPFVACDGCATGFRRCAALPNPSTDKDGRCDFFIDGYIQDIWSGVSTALKKKVGLLQPDIAYRNSLVMDLLQDVKLPQSIADSLISDAATLSMLEALNKWRARKTKERWDELMKKEEF